ncbi:Ku80 family protein [Actinidia rufa]|uniref:Ku80 family protein n=1 Tax=Actinidia rufa TaxID=165716 RepID=A0A7J0F6D6_9ERIC|nr:Ku80 family protein [Actinidia rufa]
MLGKQLKIYDVSAVTLEALVLVLDVGPSMHNTLQEIEKVCSMLVTKKLIFSKNDEVGVVLFGTEKDELFLKLSDTNNELTKEVGGYEHVVVLRHIKVVDGDAVEALQQLPRGTAAGDYMNSIPYPLRYQLLKYVRPITQRIVLDTLTLLSVLDAIVVGMDMLIKKFGQTNKGKKRLCLVTNALCPIKDPYEGTKEDQVNAIASQMSAHGMKMDCIVVRGKQNVDENKRVMEENDFLLGIFSRKTSSKVVYAESPTSLLGSLRTRNISPVTTYRGDLEISSSLKIKLAVDYWILSLMGTNIGLHLDINIGLHQLVCNSAEAASSAH